MKHDYDMYLLLQQVKDRVCVTKHDGVFLLIVNAFPVDDEGKELFDKDFHLSCK